jgi:hypothetical protein
MPHGKSIRLHILSLDGGSGTLSTSMQDDPSPTITLPEAYGQGVGEGNGGNGCFLVLMSGHASI